MDHLHTIRVASVEDLIDNAAAWDDLWWRSDVALPLARAESLVQWIEHFRPRADFRALVVAHADRWIAALPIVSHRVGWLISSGELPGNSWSPCGELLCDATAATEPAMDMLLAAAVKLPWQLLWFNEAELEAPRWQALFRPCKRANLATHYHERYRVGRVEIDGSWELFRKRLPKSHRQGMCRAARRLKCEGEMQFEMRSRLDLSEVEPWLAEAFKVEDLGWKGAGGTSVLRTPGMFRFFVRQAEQLARWGQLETAALRLDGRMLAFVYGFRAKGIYFAHKIGYDPSFSAFSPGQLLFYHILERLHNDGQTGALDFVGPMNQSLSRWRPTTYGVGRIALAPRRLLGRAAMYAYRNVWRRLRPVNEVVPACTLTTPAAPVPSRAIPPAADVSPVPEATGTSS